MKTYTGWRDERHLVVVKVTEPGKPDYDLPLRLDLYNHSPDGFEIGYSGSGPAQLALAIVADAIGAPMGKKPPSGFEHDSNKRLMAVRLHQDFKRQFIAGLARDLRWTITEKTVLEFTARYQKESTDVDTQS